MRALWGKECYLIFMNFKLIGISNQIYKYINKYKYIFINFVLIYLFALFQSYFSLPLIFANKIQ